MASNSGAPRPGRKLGIVAVVVIGLLLGVFFATKGSPQLGLDLRGGTSVILTAQAPKHGKVTPQALDQAVNIIRQRVNGLGVSEAQVTKQGNNHLVVAVPGKGRQQVVSLVGQTAQLRFRQVVQEAAGRPTAPPNTTPSPNTAPPGKAKKTPSPKATPSGKAKKTPSPKATHTPSGKAKVRPSSKPRSLGRSGSLGSASWSGRGGVHPAALHERKGGSTASPSPSRSGGAASATAVPQAKSAQALAKKFARFTCNGKKHAAAGSGSPDQYLIACDDKGQAKYLLAPAKVEGTGVSDASAVLDSQQGQGWLVQLSFKHDAGKKWGNLTKKAYDAGAGKPGNQVAIVLDGVVKSAPAIQEPIYGGNAQITGNFSQKSASDLANVLKYGALPLKFEKSSVQDVSPTLGSEQLRGGFIAGAIGLGLVVLYLLFYYRGLGLVAIGSLSVSGLILYAATTVLGKTIGYTLTLAGIAGYIVAVGITADSFIVFFERLRDEVRESRGGTLRSAVEKAWPRARRTILSADTVSILAAVVLYFIAVGGVKGFAFTLGLSTVSDVFIVFLFTKPLVTLLARTRSFGSGRKWTGVGAALTGGPRSGLRRNRPTVAARQAPAPSQARSAQPTQPEGGAG